MSESEKFAVAPHGVAYARWARDWHKINPGASRTRCGRLLAAEGSSFDKNTPPKQMRCRVCFPAWERLT